MTYTGQAGEHHWSDRSLLVKPGNFHRKGPLYRSGWCSSPVKPVQAKKPQIYQTGLPTSKLTPTRNNSNTGQQRTHLARCSPEQNSTKGYTGQIGERHRSDRCDLSSRDEQHPQVNSPKSNSRSPESLHGFVQYFGDSSNTSWALHSKDFVYQNLLNPKELKKSHQQHL
jgi:hypothetical protein